MALLVRLLRKRFVLALLTLCFSGAAIAAMLLWNMQLANIINMVNAGQPLQARSIAGALVSMLSMAATAYVKEMVSGYTCESMGHDLRMGYARRFSSLSMPEIESLNAGEQLSQLQNEIVSVSDYLNSNLFPLIDDAVRFLATFVWLLALNATLTLSSNLPLLVILLYVVWSSKIIGASTGKSQQAKAEMNRYADTLLTLFPMIRLYDAFKVVLRGYQDALAQWEEQTIRLERTKARLLSLSAVLNSLPLLLLFLVGGGMVIRGTLNIGTLYVFLNLSGNLSGALRNAPGHIASFRQFSVNMERVQPNVSL